MAARPLATLRVPTQRQGPTGRGQGGWTACRFAEATGRQVTVRLNAPTPLNRDLHVLADGDGFALVDPAETPGETPDDPPGDTLAKVIMQAAVWTPDIPDTTPISIAAAAAARGRFIYADGGHPVPLCFSCGLHAGSMHVHGGLLADGRVATDFRPPVWAVRRDRSVDPAVVWAALDCASGWYAVADDASRVALTAQYAVDIVGRLDPHGVYAIVAWHGDAHPGWEGRKRSTCASMFNAAGAVVARARALWISV